MGVGGLPPRLAAGLWTVALAVAALPPVGLSARVAAGSGLLGLTVWAAAPRLGPVATSGLLAVGAAPLFASAVLRASAIDAALLVALVLLVAVGRRGAPRTLPWGLAALGAALSLRQAGLEGLLPGAAVPAAGLALLGLAAGGSVVAPSLRGLGVALAVGAGVVGGQVLLEESRPPASAAEAQSRAARHGFAEPTEALLARPGWALAALSAAPSSHELALALAPSVGLERALAAGWRPAGAPLAPEPRVEVARWLDARGRGGEALRLLWAGRRSGPTVAWWGALFAREQGRALVWGEGTPPPEARALPGAHALDEAFYRNGSAELLLQLDQPISALRLQVEGEAFEGPPTLTVSACGRPLRQLDVPAGPVWLAVAEGLPAGPCRLRLRFDNDHSGPGGDRNLRVRALAAP